MADSLTRLQRRGTAIFLGLCVLTLAAAIWRNTVVTSSPDDEAAEAVLRSQLDSIKPVTDSLYETPPKERKYFRTKDKSQSKRSKKSTSAPEAPPVPRSPLDEPVNLK